MTPIGRWSFTVVLMLTLAVGGCVLRPMRDPGQKW